ncbi:unnamed protein product [Acanthosepion pharaonis]|uniref:Uncharacterized protein n=1 Tax=Acanthosepion pharaonis TaxID=158019 RepID=A0A812CJ18_ACAPH|nr:unnamed protein product [Sepia pharaonis]
MVLFSFPFRPVPPPYYASFSSLLILFSTLYHNFYSHPFFFLFILLTLLLFLNRSLPSTLFASAAFLPFHTPFYSFYALSDRLFSRLYSLYTLLYRLLSRLSFTSSSIFCSHLLLILSCSLPPYRLYSHLFFPPPLYSSDTIVFFLVSLLPFCFRLFLLYHPPSYFFIHSSLPLPLILSCSFPLYPLSLPLSFPSSSLRSSPLLNELDILSW